MPDEPLIQVLDTSGIKDSTDALQGMGKAISGVSAQFESLGASAQQRLAMISKNASDLSRQLDELGRRQSSGPALGQPMAPSAQSANSSSSSTITNALGNVTTALERMTTKFTETITNVFGRGGANPSGPTSNGEAFSQGMNWPTSGPTSGSAGGGAGGGTSTSTGGGGLSAGLLADAGIGAALFGVGALGRAAAGPTTAGNSWSAVAQNIAPFLGFGYGQGGTQSTSAAMVGTSGFGQGFGSGITGPANVLWGGNVGALGGAESSLMGIGGNYPGSTGYKQQLAQSGAVGFLTGGTIQSGAQGEAWLATAAGRNFLYTIGLDPNNSDNQNVAGVAESIATRLNGGTFPNAQALKAMIGPGQPLTNTLSYLAMNMGMDPNSFVPSIESLLMKEAQSANNGQMVSLGAATSAGQVGADMQALGYTKLPQYMNQQQKQLSAIRGRKSNVQTSYTAAQTQLTKEQTLNKGFAAGGGATDWLQNAFGKIEGLLGPYMKEITSFFDSTAGILSLYAGSKVLSKLRGKGKGGSAEEDEAAGEEGGVEGVETAGGEALPVEITGVEGAEGATGAAMLADSIGLSDIIGPAAIAGGVFLGMTEALNLGKQKQTAIGQALGYIQQGKQVPKSILDKTGSASSTIQGLDIGITGEAPGGDGTAITKHSTGSVKAGGGHVKPTSKVLPTGQTASVVVQKGAIVVHVHGNMDSSVTGDLTSKTAKALQKQLDMDRQASS